MKKIIGTEASSFLKKGTGSLGPWVLAEPSDLPNPEEVQDDDATWRAFAGEAGGEWEQLRLSNAATGQTGSLVRSG